MTQTIPYEVPGDRGQRRVQAPVQPLYPRYRRRTDFSPIHAVVGAVLVLFALVAVQVHALRLSAASKEQVTEAAVVPVTVATPEPLPSPLPPVRVARRWDGSRHARPPKGEFVRFFRMTATAYTPINTRMEGGRYTKVGGDGRREHGVAVDPDLIPLGSKLWIPGYGHAVADDTGGRIQGHRVDLRMQHYGKMQEWGVKPVRVYVLQEPQDE